MRILIPDATYDDGGAVERAAFGPEVDLRLFRWGQEAAIPEDEWGAADGLLVTRYHISPAMVARLGRARIVVRYGVGFDNLDLAALGAAGIPACNVPDYGTNEVADHAIGLMLALRRGITHYWDALHDDPIKGWRWGAALVRRLKGQRFGIVGLGRIGTAAALRARAFGFEVAFYDPYLAVGHEIAFGFERAETLEALLASSDIVSLHCPANEETTGMIDTAALAAIKPGAILINTARGTVVDLDAVWAALESGHLGGAALDVLPKEPPDPAHPLIAAYCAKDPRFAGRLILTPHAAFYSPESAYDMRFKAAQTARDYLITGKLRNCVNENHLRGTRRAC